MKAVRVHAFGGTEALRLDTLETPAPGPGQTLVRVRAAGVGPWDAWIRTGQSTKVSPADLPLILGSDIAGVVDVADPADPTFAVGDAVLGVTNGHFTGGYATHALAETNRLVRLPASLTFDEAASLPVIAVTAWEAMTLVEDVRPHDAVTILGAAGNVGRLLVQLARLRGLHVFALGAADPSRPADDAVRWIDRSALDDACGRSRAVLDTVGGDVLRDAAVALPPGGAVVSIVEPLDVAPLGRGDLAAHYFIVDVRVRSLSAVAALAALGLLTPQVGTVLPLADARLAHEMIDGRRDHPRGKIVLTM